jgi:hypothetical protein
LATTASSASGISWSRLSNNDIIHGCIFASKSPGRDPMSAPIGMTGFESTMRSCSPVPSSHASWAIAVASAMNIFARSGLSSQRNELNFGVYQEVDRHPLLEVSW